MTRKTHARAFTLIELLTVIAIIALLIGILAPALGRARDEAKKARIRSNITGISNALEILKTEDGQYPTSTAGDLFDPTRDWEVGNTAANRLQGAHLLVDAVSGRDFIGYDPRPTVGTTYNRWVDTNSRKGPFLDVTSGSIETSKVGEPVEDAFGNLPVEATPTIDNLFCPIFLDAFSYPLLYYRANPNATNRSPMLPVDFDSATDRPGPNSGSAIYNGRDNLVFTRHSGGAGQDHKIKDAEQPYSPSYPLDPNNPTSIQSDFARYIMSFRKSTRNPANSSQVTFLRPVNDTLFIIVSPGKDGIYGTIDDLTNGFDVNSENR